MLASLQNYLNNLKSSINELKTEEKLRLINLKKQQIWQFTELYGQYLELKPLFKELLNELKTIDLSLEDAIKADILNFLDLGDREDVDSYLCASIIQAYTHFLEIEASLTDAKKDSDRSLI